MNGDHVESGSRLIDKRIKRNEPNSFDNLELIPVDKRERIVR